MKGLNDLQVEVKALVVPVLQWGDEEIPIHDLLTARATALDAVDLLRRVLRDLDKMQRTVADAENSDAETILLKAQKADHAAHARIIRQYLEGLDS